MCYPEVGDDTCQKNLYYVLDYLSGVFTDIYAFIAPQTCTRHPPVLNFGAALHCI